MFAAITIHLIRYYTVTQGYIENIDSFKKIFFEKIQKN